MSYDNSITVRGNLARDIDLRYSAAGKAFAVSAVAVSEGKDKEASFVDFIIFGELAERAAESFEKGNRVIVVGTITQDRWETDSGEKRSKLKVIASDIGASVFWNTVTINRTQGWTGPTDDDLI